MNCYLNSLLLLWTALTTAFSLPQFRQRTVSFSGDGPERSLRHLRAMAAACRTDGHVVSSRQNVDGVHSSTLRSAGASFFGVVRPLPKAVNRGAKCRSVSAKRGKKISPSFFSCLDGLSWHLRALHCTVTAFCFP